jgi:c-di-GMP-related signal transduction protein
LIVHTDDVVGLRTSQELRALLPYFQIVKFDMHAIAKDTEFEGAWVLDVVDSKAYLTGTHCHYHHFMVMLMP